MNTSAHCLNCGKELVDKFCSGCGQKADTHRISFANFVSHDVLHGTFHLEKGILYTARQALKRPGKAALDYISGKRKRFYNVFYLILITLGVIVFIRHLGEVIYVNQGGVLAKPEPYINDASRKFGELFSQKSKIIIFLFVPLSAMTSFFLFRRKKLNLSEHSILSGMILLGVLLLIVIADVFFLLNYVIPFGPGFSLAASLFFTFAMFFYVAYGYWNAFAEDYTKAGMGLRIFLFFALLFLEVALLFVIAFGVLTDWQFGTLRFSPLG